MNKIKELIKPFCPDGVKRVPLWQVTVWDRKFRSVERTKQPTIHPYKHLLAKHLFALNVEGGDVKLLSTGLREGWTTCAKAGEFLCEGEIVSIPWGKSRGVKVAVKYWNGRFVTADNRIASSRDAGVLLNKFLYYWLLEQEEALEKCYRGTSILHPDMGMVLDMEMPLPPLPVQREVVRVLDSFTGLLLNLRQEIGAREKVYASILQDLLVCSDPSLLIPLGSLFKFKNGLYKEKSAFGHGTPIVNYKDVYALRGLTAADIKGRVKLMGSEKSRYAVQRGDVFFTRTSEFPEDVGMPSVLLEDIPDCTFSGFVLRARPVGDCLLPSYCKYCFMSAAFRQGVVRSASYTARALTNGRVLSRIPVYVPSKEKQAEIVSSLEAYEHIIQNIRDELSLRLKQYEYYRKQFMKF